LPYQHQYTTATLDASHTSLPVLDAAGKMHKEETTWGLRLHAGADQQTQLYTDSLYVPYTGKKRTFLFAVNPYWQGDRRYYGLGVGMLLGNLGYHKINSGDEFSVLDVQFSARVGSRQSVFAQADYNYLGYGMANPQHRIGLGTGFGGTRWRLLAGGARSKDYDMMPGATRWSGFAEARGQVDLHWSAGAFTLFGNRQQRQVGIQLSRRFGQ
jgi:phosphatidylglycerol:prolipoprotein diacylglycerol transferase